MPKLTPPLAAALSALGALLALAGCDQPRVARLEEGLSTEADVRREFGEPADVFVEADGGRTFEYPRQPEGWQNWFITIGPDGRMSALRQVLTEANFARVSPGLDQAEVRRLLGRPARTQLIGPQRDQVWSWRYRPDPNTSRLFSVTFDAQGRVVSTGTSPDPRETEGQ